MHTSLLEGSVYAGFPSQTPPAPAALSPQTFVGPAAVEERVCDLRRAGLDSGVGSDLSMR